MAVPFTVSPPEEVPLPIVVEAKNIFVPDQILFVVVLNARPIVEPVRVTGYVTDIVFCLLLNVVQSVFESSPRIFVAEAVGIFNV